MINLVKVSLQNFKDQNKKVVLLTQTYPALLQIILLRTFR